jgi:hypothetical protein
MKPALARSLDDVAMDLKCIRMFARRELAAKGKSSPDTLKVIDVLLWEAEALIAIDDARRSARSHA